MKMSLNVLKERGWLSYQPASVQEGVLAAGRIREIERGSTVFSVGDPPGGAYGILEGEMAIEVAPDRAGPHFVHIGTPGWWFGDLSFLTGQPRRATFRAADKSRLFYLTLDAMERLFGSNAEMMRRFAQIGVLNFDLALRKIEILLDPDPARRIAAMLLNCLGGRSRSVITVSQADLGHMCNVSRNTVGRVIGSFVERGWVSQGYAHIEVLHPAELERFTAEQ
jgi:CRP-like cAMP-binding protein